MKFNSGIIETFLCKRQSDKKVILKMGLLGENYIFGMKMAIGGLSNINTV